MKAPQVWWTLGWIMIALGGLGILAGLTTGASRGFGYYVLPAVFVFIGAARIRWAARTGKAKN